MSETKFTPGPHLVEREPDGDYTVWTRQPHTGILATVRAEDINGEYPAEANANLFGAATELYDAVAAAEDYLGSLPAGDDAAYSLFLKMKKARAKARGDA